MKMTKLLALTAALALGSVSAAFAQVTQLNISPLTLSQSAVFTGGVTTEGPVVGGNLWGITCLPRGTELVRGIPAGEQAIILPGMVGLPSLAAGCNAQVVAASEPSALSLISANTIGTQAGAMHTKTTVRQTRTRGEARVIHTKRVHRRIVKRGFEGLRRRHMERRLIEGKRGEKMLRKHSERRLLKNRHKTMNKSTANKNEQNKENNQNKETNQNNTNNNTTK